MLFRFTLSNTIEGSHIISDPDGWKEIKLKLSRHEEYHSLVELIDLPLIFYRSSDLVDGGYDYIRNVEQTQGLDAQITILIEVSEDHGETYETFFQGLLELETIKDISDADFYKLECNIIRNDFWSKFINRKSQKVNLSATTDLDGSARTPVSNITLSLPSQKIRKFTKVRAPRGSLTTSEPGYDVFNLTLTAALPYAALDLEIQELDEAKQKFNLPVIRQSSIPLELFEIKEAGSYQITSEIWATRNTSSGILGLVVVGINLYYRLNDGSPVAFTQSDTIVGADQNSKFTFSTTVDLSVGDLIYFWIEDVAGASRNFFLLYDGIDNLNSGVTTSYIQIQGETITTNTETDAFLLKDAAESILSKTIGRDNVLFSNYLGDETPIACGANFAIMNGLHIRGYSLADKPMYMSFDEWWSGTNPILNLGLGYETILGTEYIRIEEKGAFYDETVVLTFYNVEKITRIYDKDKIFKSIEIGFQKWSAESASGVDDPQTKHTYNTRFKTVGKDQKILSEFIAASLAIEQTRRNRVEEGKDWRLDEDIIVIATDSTNTQPELDENFSGITDLLNYDTRYNIRLTPARALERWKPYFNGCLQSYLSNYYKFASSEGNSDMQSTGDGSCDSGTLAENQDIAVSSEYYHTHIQFEFQKEMSFSDYKTLRDNRKNAIAVSNTTTGHKTCFIEEMEYDHFNAIGSFKVWIKDTDFSF